MENPSQAHPAGLLSRRHTLASLISGLFWLAGCGGGGAGLGLGAGGAATLEGGPGEAAGSTGGSDVSVAGVSSGGTGSTSVGSITGFGSVMLNGNGVRIDDSAATVTDEDGADLKGKLKLGMQLIVNSTTAASGAVTAQSIVAGGELRGRIENINAGVSFTVLGQDVRVLASTVFDAEAGPAVHGLAGLALNDIVEVHGFLDAKRNELTATYVLRKTSASYFKIQGEIRVKGATKLEIGALKVDFAGANGTPVDQSVMRIRLVPASPPLPGEWAATRIRGVENLGQNRDLFEIEARISDFTSSTQFKVAGLQVDASGSGVVVINPTALVLANGVRLEVKGMLSAGVLVAQQIKFEDEGELNALEYELHGTVAALTGNVVAGGFTLSGATNQSILYDASTQYVNGMPTDLANGRAVEVKGTASPTGAGTVIAATRIKFE